MLELVALDLPGGPAFAETLRRVWEEGDAAAPLDPRLPAPARRAVLVALRPTAVVGPDGERRGLAGGVGVEPGDALVLATSGSSGAPKGVVLTHDALAASARATSDALAVDPARDRWLACLPLAHIGGLAVVTRALLTGTPLEVHPRFDPAAVEAAARDGATLVSLVTTAWRRIDGSLFRQVVLGGAAPPSGLPPNVRTTWGMTETGSGVVYDGEPLPGVELRLGRDTGEILVRAPMLLRCYRDGTDPRTDDGWFPTGDAGTWDGSGRLRVQGRLAEVIVTGGEKVWPNAVETVIGSLAEVAEVAVVGRPDPEWGEAVVAYVVPAPGAAPPRLEALRAEVAATLAPWAAPRHLVVADALPRLPGGKLDRRSLRAPSLTG